MNTAQTKEPHENNSQKIYVTIDKLNSRNDAAIKAWVSVHVGSDYAIHGIKVVQGNGEIFTLMPRIKNSLDGNEQYVEAFQFLSPVLRDEINKAILKTYDKKLLTEAQEI